MNFGTGEMLFIAILFLVLYGKRLPEITRALGKGISEMKRSLNEMKQDISREASLTEPSGQGPGHQPTSLPDLTPQSKETDLPDQPNTGLAGGPRPNDRSVGREAGKNQLISINTTALDSSAGKSAPAKAGSGSNFIPPRRDSAGRAGEKSEGSLSEGKDLAG